MLIWTIYDHPKDFPDHYVARQWWVDDKGGMAQEMLLKAETLPALRRMLPPGLYRLDASEGDDAVIVETWI